MKKMLGLLIGFYAVLLTSCMTSQYFMQEISNHHDHSVQLTESDVAD